MANDEARRVTGRRADEISVALVQQSQPDGPDNAHFWDAVARHAEPAAPSTGFDERVREAIDRALARRDETPAAASGALRARREALAYKETPGTLKVVTETIDSWTDVARGRVVPAMVYAPHPDGTSSRLPLVLVTPGFGESRSSYAGLALHWASHGYVTIVVSHAGTDTESLRLGSRPPADPVHLRLRAQDLRFVLDELASTGDASALIGDRLDLRRVAVAGHSLGSTTAMQLAGLTTNLPDEPAVSFRDSRVRAAIGMSQQFRSPRYPANGRSASTRLGVTAESWKSIQTPALFIFGTKDVIFRGRLAASERVLDWVFGETIGPSRYAVKILGARHDVFTDSESWYSTGGRDPRHHGWICQATTAFLDAHLNDDVEAFRWLQDRLLEEVSAGDCLIEAD